MKRLFFMMVIVSTLIISTLNSCNKDDSFPDQALGVTVAKAPITLNLTTNRWETMADGVFVNTFKNVIPGGYRGQLVEIYLVTNGQDTLINQAIRFMDGALYATSTETDIGIVYRGISENIPYLNIKVVIE